jgi:hypothetical protein
MHKNKPLPEDVSSKGLRLFGDMAAEVMRVTPSAAPNRYGMT